MPCPHKNKMLTCSKCSEKVCSRCVQLEAHACTGLAFAIEMDRALLEKKLVKVVAPKVPPMSS
jgi:hypothetical protein